jgi:hypothetical protein
MEGVTMDSTSEIFLQEEQAKLGFTRAIADLRSSFSNIDSPQFLTAFDALTEATLRFGTCELRMRRAERLDALRLAKPEVKHLKITAITNNERGLAALMGIRPFVDELASTKSSPEALALWRKSSPDLRAEWRDQISQVNVSAENARHLVRIMDECCEAVDRDGAAGLGKHLSATFAELEKQRRAPNRGTQEASFPWWKIVAGAALLGISIWACFERLSSPWWNFSLALTCFAIIFVMSMLGC